MLKTHITQTSISDMDITKMRIFRAVIKGSDNEKYCLIFDESVETLAYELGISKSEAEIKLKPYVFARLEQENDKAQAHWQKNLSQNMVQYASGNPSESKH